MSCVFFFFKQKTAYEMRISDWSSDVCSSDLRYFGADPGKRYGGQGPRGGRLEVDFRLLVVFTDRHQHGGQYHDKRCALRGLLRHAKHQRSEERRVGQECVRTCRSWWSPSHYTKQNNQQTERCTNDMEK